MICLIKGKTGKKKKEYSEKGIKESVLKYAVTKRKKKNANFLTKGY